MNAATRRVHDVSRIVIFSTRGYAAKGRRWKSEPRDWPDRQSDWKNRSVPWIAVRPADPEILSRY